MKKRFIPYALVMTFAVFSLAFSACGWGKPACVAIDAMQNACNVIKYLGPDGKEHTVSVSREELQSFAGATAAARARATKDAGAP